MNADGDSGSIASCDALNDETFDVDIPDEEWEFDGDEPEDEGSDNHVVSGSRTPEATSMPEAVIRPPSQYATATLNSSGVIESGDGGVSTESLERMIEMTLTDLIDEKEDFMAFQRRHLQRAYANGRYTQNVPAGPPLMSETVMYQRNLYAAPMSSAEMGPQHVRYSGSRVDGYSSEQPVEVKGTRTLEELEAGLSWGNDLTANDSTTSSASVSQDWLFNGANMSHSSGADLPPPTHLSGVPPMLPPHPVCPVAPDGAPFVRPFQGNGALPPFYGSPMGARMLPHPLVHCAGMHGMHPPMRAPRGPPPAFPVVRPPTPGSIPPPDVYRNLPNSGFRMPDQRSCCPYVHAYQLPRYSPNTRMPMPFGRCHHLEGAGFPGRFFPLSLGPGRLGMHVRPVYPRMGSPPVDLGRYAHFRGHFPRGGRPPAACSRPPFTMMSKCERTWISRVMSSMQINENDDYYYRTWCQKKGVHPKEEEIKDTESDPSSSPIKAYEPPKFEGSLGAIQQITTDMPRRLLVVSASPTGQMVSVEVPNICTLHTRKNVLLYVDNLFLVLLADDCDYYNDDDRSKATRELVAAKLRPHLGNADILRYVLQVVKGQELFARYLNLTQHNVLLLLNSVVDVLPALMMVDFNGEALQRILTILNRSVQESADAEVKECLKIVKDEFKSLSPGCFAGSKFTYSVALCIALRCSKRSRSRGASLKYNNGADVKKLLDQIVGSSVACPLTDEELMLFGSRVLRHCMQRK
ncbi:hypothetical protein D918_01800 [Trichuris suis]|nr:hypothetical protein D918_01800 [Trichuris suis]